MNYFGAIGPFQIVIVFVFLIALAPTIIALIDILKSEFKGNDKLIWVLVVLLLNFFGAVIYFLIGREQKIQTTKVNKID